MHEIRERTDDDPRPSIDSSQAAKEKQKTRKKRQTRKRHTEENEEDNKMKRKPYSHHTRKHTHILVHEDIKKITQIHTTSHVHSH